VEEELQALRQTPREIIVPQPPTIVEKQVYVEKPIYIEKIISPQIESNGR